MSTHEMLRAPQAWYVCWPKVKLGDDVFHLSTQLIGLMNKTDAGKEVDLGFDEANYLNGQGIVTALNWIGGWRAWGNRTAAYPANTDAKDCFIPIRRMFDWIGNEFILTMWQKVDAPMTPRLIGLSARQFILGGRIEFNSTENPTTDLLNGILRFHIYITPPPPAEQIWGIFEFDPDYFEVLFEAAA